MNQFEEQFLDQKQITTLMVLYYRPDYRSIIQEFVWQTLDVPPRFQRVHKFLNYWKTEIRVPIREVRLAVAGHLMPTDIINPTVYQA